MSSPETQPDSPRKIDPFSPEVVDPPSGTDEPGAQTPAPPKQLSSRLVKIVAVVLVLCLCGYVLAQIWANDARKAEQEVIQDKPVVALDTEAAERDAEARFEQEKRRKEKEKREQEMQDALAKAEPTPPSFPDRLDPAPPSPTSPAPSATALPSVSLGDRLESTRGVSSGSDGSVAREPSENPWEAARVAYQKRRAETFYQNRAAALDAPIFFAGGEPAGLPESARERSEPRYTERYPEAQLDSQRAFLAQLDEQVPSAHPAASSSTHTSRHGFGQRGQGSRGERRQADSTGARAHQISANTVVMGTLMEVVLESGISSEHDSMVLARLARPVYDHTMSRVLVPSGARLIGRLEGGAEPGQTRAAVSFERLILADGRSIPMQGMGTSMDGATGLPGQVDEHWDKMVAATVLAGGISASGSALSGPTNALQTQPRQQAIQGAGQSAQGHASALIERYIKADPTLTIAPGQRIGVILERDLLIAASSASRVPLRRHH